MMKNPPSIKKLPEAEFEIMKTLWSLPSPATTNQILLALEDGKKWKPQTLATFLARLVDRGFISTTKKGKERSYTPIIKREAYLAFETKTFVKDYHNSSFIQLANTFYGDRPLTNDEIDDLLTWVKERRE